MRIFLDANVLFSASSRGTNTARLVELALREHTVVTCDLAFEEAKRNIALKRADWGEALDQLRSQIQCVPTKLFELSVNLFEKDRPILCSAIDSACDLLATGDKRHFGHLFDLTIQGVTVVSLVGLAHRIISDIAADN